MIRQPRSSPPFVRSREAGFSLLEVLMTMTVMAIALAGTMQIMTTAMRQEDTAKEMLDMNTHLRAAMDLVQRDLLQVGQGLPVGRRVGIPNGPGATRINRPGPAATGGCPGVNQFPVDSTLPAISVGPALGPPLNGACTDIITTLAADNLFVPNDGLSAAVPIAAIAANGGSVTIHDSVNISDNPDARFDNVRPGDLLMLSKGNSSVLMQVTAVAGQVVSFGTGAGIDPLGLNQFDPDTDDDNVVGTINDHRVAAPEDSDVIEVDNNGLQIRQPSEATRIRMVTYFIAMAGTPPVPRLVRIVNGAQANAVGLGVAAFQVSYDIADQVNNPANVRMVAADLNGTGACNDTQTPDAEECSPNQIRKVNVLLSMRTLRTVRPGEFEGRQAQNTLYTQVSLRSMAFVDRYR